MTTSISRRSLIAGSIAGTAAIAAPAFAKAAPKWDETVDVIVVGTGFAALPLRSKRRRPAPTSSFSRR